MEYKLVPVEPTREMIEAAQRTQEGFVDDVYKALLAAAPSPSWIETAERLPTREDSDENGDVWVAIAGNPCTETEWWEEAGRWDYWMPKPRQQPPEPPALQERK